MDADKKTVSNKVQSYLHLIQRLAMLLYNTKLYYGLNNPLVMKESSEVLSEIENLTLKKDTLTFAVLGNTMFVNGEKLEIRDGLSKQFTLNLTKLSLGALDLRPGLTINELSTLMSLLINNDNLKGKPEIKKYLDEHDVKHIIPHLATYQLVQENEQVVKEGSVVDVDKLSSKVVKDYASDLKHASANNKTPTGTVDEISKFLFNLSHNLAEGKPAEESKILPDLKDGVLKSGGQVNSGPSPEVVGLFSSDLRNGVIRDKLLMRDPMFLCKVLTNLTQAINTMEELSRIIWTIGEFLISDISLTKEIEANRKVCEQLNNHLVAQWQQKESKEQGKKIIEESFAKIITAIQIKKYIFAYIKHKKGLEVVLKKINKMLKDVPEDNVLYQQIKNELRKIGSPKYDSNMFE
ncbi:MAG: hypothetical protein KJ964_01325 [Verrucomicrobia bacterium]|nr:hypothetical protein [Verrucomicrobiota bacterium]MBU1734943.1 hypothetical protein [Verrucomicrobiota bacterium]MBU1857904.1 hypothetical protein [Verrucomicrobiota bacterium]